MTRLLVVTATPDPAAVDGALSGMGRVWEVYGFEGVVVLVSPSAPKLVVERLVGWARSLGADAEAVELREGPGPGAVGEVVGAVAERCGGGEALLLVSGASRWLASVLGLAAAELRGRGCAATLVHVHFFFGAWSGLVYPYTPAALEPVQVLGPGEAPARGRGAGAAASRAPPLPEECGGSVLAPGRLPPLRCAVGELARRLNAGAAGRSLRVWLDGEVVGEARPLEPSSTARLAERLLEAFTGFRLGAALQRQGNTVAAWTGLSELAVHGVERALARGRRLVLVDTNLLYYGAHLLRWEGLPVAVPECVVGEVERRLAEAMKHGRLQGGRDLVAALAYLGLLDLLGSGAPVVPTPPGPCDTAIPKADPFILQDAVLATADDGAYRYWRSHPASKLADAVKVYHNPSRQSWSGAEREPRRLSRLYYAAHQALLVLGLMEAQGMVQEAALEAEGRRIDLGKPVGVLLDALGLATA